MQKCQAPLYVQTDVVAYCIYIRLSAQKAESNINIKIENRSEQRKNDYFMIKKM